MSSSQQVGSKPAAIAHKEPTLVQGKQAAVEQGKPEAVQQGKPVAAQQQQDDHFISGSSTTHTHPHHHHHHHGVGPALVTPHMQQAAVGQQDQLPPALAPEQKAQIAPEQKPAAVEQKPAAVAQKPAAVAHKEHTIAPVGQQQQGEHEHVQQEHEHVAQSLSQLDLGAHQEQQETALVGQHDQSAFVGQHDQSAAAAQQVSATQSVLQTITLSKEDVQAIYHAYCDQKAALAVVDEAPTAGDVAYNVRKSAALLHSTFDFFLPNGLGNRRDVTVYVKETPSHLQLNAHPTVRGPLTVSL